MNPWSYPPGQPGQPNTGLNVNAAAQSPGAPMVLRTDIQQPSSGMSIGQSNSQMLLPGHQAVSFPVQMPSAGLGWLAQPLGAHAAPSFTVHQGAAAGKQPMEAPYMRSHTTMPRMASGAPQTLEGNFDAQSLSPTMPHEAPTTLLQQRAPAVKAPGLHFAHVSPLAGSLPQTMLHGHGGDTWTSQLAFLSQFQGQGISSLTLGAGPAAAQPAGFDVQIPGPMQQLAGIAGSAGAAGSAYVGDGQDFAPASSLAGWNFRGSHDGFGGEMAQRSKADGGGFGSTESSQSLPHSPQTPSEARGRGLGASQPKKCVHSRQKNKCKDCKGTGICEHGRLRRMCKQCGGSGICEHQRQWAICTECKGSQICEHNRRKSRCKECGGVQICRHMRRRSRCKDCGGSAICEHLRERRLCKDCRGSGICEHLRQRRFCKQCKSDKPQPDGSAGAASSPPDSDSPSFNEASSSSGISASATGGPPGARARGGRASGGHDASEAGAGRGRGSGSGKRPAVPKQ